MFVYRLEDAVEDGETGLGVVAGLGESLQSLTLFFEIFEEGDFMGEEESLGVVCDLVGDLIVMGFELEAAQRYGLHRYYQFSL
jgi:hypothetical protein